MLISVKYRKKLSKILKGKVKKREIQENPSKKKQSQVS